MPRVAVIEKDNKNHLAALNEETNVLHLICSNCFPDREGFIFLADNTMSEEVRADLDVQLSCVTCRNTIGLQ